MEFIIENEGGLRLGIFGAVMALMMGLEAMFARKKRTQGRGHRWLTNLLIIVVDSLTVRLIFPIVAAGAALWAQAKGFGLLNVTNFPLWLDITISVIILDMMIYWQHVASHKIPMLWALHQMHHVDRDIDATTGIRFHPIEIIASMLYKMLCIIILGAPMAAVIIFEITLNASAVFNHANMRLPLKLDAVIRKFLVTPDMHRVHHSVIPAETNSNYGFALSIWDRLFGSYIDQPREGHDSMIIGLPHHQHDGPSSLIWSLILPFGRGLKRARQWL
ncbi:MAG: sterol desaturase family protein [Robiginitomaculum sp.]